MKRKCQKQVGWSAIFGLHAIRLDGIAEILAIHRICNDWSGWSSSRVKPSHRKIVLYSGSLQGDFQNCRCPCFLASACGSANGKLERRRRDAGTKPKRNNRRRTAGGSTPTIRCHAMPLVTSAFFAERKRRGRVGDRADLQPVQ